MHKKRLFTLASLYILLHCSCAAQPVQDSGNVKKHDLVELVKIDTSIHLDIKYATKDNFLKRSLYTEARAFLQRPAAMALAEVNKELKLLGYGLLVFDAYRPWSVTKILWDSTADINKQFVADPAKGSRHNRGAAVDLTLYELSSGKEIQMPGYFDEMTERSYSTYTGGTLEQRTMRDLLRNKMETHGFEVLENEWWHFDYKDWRSYSIGNQTFENIANKDLTTLAETTSISWTASWSYDDKFIAIGNDKGELAIYESANWQKLKSWSYTATTITRLEWNPKNLILAVASVSYEGKPDVIQLYDFANDIVLKTLPDSMRGRCLSWSASGDEIAFVGAKGRISILSKDGRLKKSLSFTHPKTIMDIDWHPTKNILLLVEEDIYLFDIDRNQLTATYDDGSKNKGILCCQWHPSGKLFVTGDYGHENEGGEPSYLKYWTMQGELLNRIKQSSFEYRNLRWRHDGKYLAATTDVLLILDEDARLVSKTRFDENNLWGVAWNSKGDKLISSDQKGNIRVTDRKRKIVKFFTH